MTRLVLSLVLSAGLVLPAHAREATSVRCPSTDSIRREILDQLRAIRAQARYCGRILFGPAKPLRWNQKLFLAAKIHAEEMSRRDYLSHRGLDGRRAGDRIVRTGYDWEVYGENIAQGQLTVSEAMRSWLDSPSHCSAIMEPDFEDVGVACASTGGGGSPYWAMVLAAPMTQARR
ncbi:CAP domain-containing protein [Methylocaldum szegediense]|uniref:SCP domain-containing protein n=1 Tax=Methylocaldum szegediense TaxID=73780 RepID=A0ABM9I3Q4_9GAMM|nr:CAP domain-containing protein [Methylocaldum szegediense]CAI8872484.1 conserved exported protein of unknown function [Methylocaldum szegediense]